MSIVLSVEQVDFTKLMDPKSGEFLVPAIVQSGGQVAMVGFMNQQALIRTLEEGIVTFFSRSSGELWTKGESSGIFLKLMGITSDCDNDTLLIDAQQRGPVCHSGAETCFG